MNSSPHTWSDWLVVIKNWLYGDIPLTSLLMTATIATLRVFYTGKGWRRLLLEVPLCCLIAVATFTLIKPVHVTWLTEDWRVSIGAAIGLIGVENIRAIGLRIAEKFAGDGK